MFTSFRYICQVFFSHYSFHRVLLSFPTRRSSDLAFLLFLNPQCLASISRWITASSSWKPSIGDRSEERFSRNAETELVCRLELENKNFIPTTDYIFDMSENKIHNFIINFYYQLT